MTAPRELSERECRELLEPGGVGRLAICVDDYPDIYPVNFAVDQGCIVFRTTPYSKLGTSDWDVAVAFEVDHQNWSTQQGWSVVVKGLASRIEDPAECDRLRELGREPTPWAGGMRRMYVRVTPREITGRAVGDGSRTDPPPLAEAYIG
jgi:nitroimidazol reductase NimA-like FMN-containing flavoprotein (pyridoxamine 5'-phosphate oxidase superfamily)